MSLVGGQQNVSGNVEAQGGDLTPGSMHVAGMVFPLPFSALRSTSSSWIDTGLITMLS